MKDEDGNEMEYCLICETWHLLIDFEHIGGNERGFDLRCLITDEIFFVEVGEGE